MQDGISVIVCTYNGSQRIGVTLEHLAVQKIISRIAWEIIVVDNASTDNTLQVIREKRDSFYRENISFIEVSESKTGKIHALAKGISHARYNHFIICDDDNRLAPDYVEKIYLRLNSDLKIGAIGGQSRAVTENEIPGWFGEVAGYYAVGAQGSDTGDATARGYLWGAGLGSRTALFHEMYKDFPSLLTGRKESKLLAGEDGEYCIRLVAKGYRLYYDETLRFDHFIPSHRLTISYRDAVIAGIHESMKIIDKYNEAVLMQHKIFSKPWNRWRLKMITPFRIWITGSESKKKRQRNKLQLLLPMKRTTDPEIKEIKKFMGIIN